jgi:DNA-binding transcriptional LysR family regulator
VPVSISIYRLQAFCVVVDQQSISRAAERLVVTQPVVSRLVAELERHYGTRLLARRGRRVLPTDAGLLVYRYGRDVLQATESTGRLVAELVDGNYGVLTVAVTTAIGSYTFPAVWQRFWQSHPRTQLILKLADSQRVLEDTRDGSADLGLAITPAVLPDVGAEPLGSVELVLVAAAGHPLTGRTIRPAELVGQTMLCTNGTSNYNNLIRALEAWGIADGCRTVRFGDTETVKRGVEIGMGLAQLARVSVASELAAGTLATVNLDGQVLQRELLLVERKDSSGSTAAAAFARFLRSHAVALLRRD